MNAENLHLEARLREEARRRELADLYAAHSGAPNTTSPPRTLRRRLGDFALRLSAAGERAAPGPLVLRAAGPSDAPGLARLAELDERPEPSGSILVAEVGEQLVAALPLEGGAAITDPFVDTAGVVVLLRLRAAQLGRAA